MQRQLQKSRLSFWSHHPSRSGTWPVLQLSSTAPVEKERKSQIKLYKVKQRKNRRWRREKRWNGSSKGIMPKCTASGVSACCLELSGTWERFFREGEIEQCWESSWCVYTCAFPATAVIQRVAGSHFTPEDQFSTSVAGSNFTLEDQFFTSEIFIWIAKWYRL